MRLRDSLARKRQQKNRAQKLRKQEQRKEKLESMCLLWKSGESGMGSS